MEFEVLLSREMTAVYRRQSQRLLTWVEWDFSVVSCAHLDNSCMRGVAELPEVSNEGSRC